MQFSLVRPKALSEMVGQEKLAHHIRKHKARGLPKAWLFYGSRGLGKTSIARILALSIQCKHSKKFGEPCELCWKCYKSYPIYELNASDKTGVDELRSFVEGSDYEVLGRGRRVYILDEAHQISKAGQNLLLKYLEDEKNKTVWIVCSTEPFKLLATLRRRLIGYALSPLSIDDITKYVKHLLKLAESEADHESLVDELTLRKIDSPGLIAQAAEKYVIGVSVAEACIESSVEIDTKALCVAVTKGVWADVASMLRDTPNSDARGLRASVVGYLKAVMLDSPEYNDRTKSLAECIKRLSYMHFSDDLVIMAALSAELYTVTYMFSKYYKR